MKYSKINGKEATKDLISEAENKLSWLKESEFEDGIWKLMICLIFVNLFLWNDKFRN